MFSQNDVDRFWAKVDKSGDCWVWTGSKRMGYGMLGYRPLGGKRTTVGAHRMSYYLAYGDPGGLFVCHRCDNPPCVRPEHLFLGTNTENIRDMQSKGRQYSVLSNEIVSQARIRASQGENVGLLAKEYGVVKEALVNAVRGKTYTHLAESPVEDIEIKTRRKTVRLTHEQVAEIQEALKHPYRGQGNHLAKKYGVVPSMISHIKNGYWSPARFMEP